MDAERALATLGFTETEAGLYCQLLRGGPATGYRLARAVGKAPANVYQALAALSQKGAVLTDEGEPKTFRAARPDEVLAALANGFETRRSAAEDALARLKPAPTDDRVYGLKSPAQVLERARAMIAGASEILLFDLFPDPLDLLTDDLGRAARRGVAVAGLVYRETALPPGVVAVLSHGEPFSDRWPGDQMSLVSDGREHLTALLARGGAEVVRAVWSDSLYLSCLQHSGMAAEIRLSAMGDSAADPLAHLSLLRSAPPGLQGLLKPDPMHDETSGDAA